MRVVTIIQARMGSTRLPGKVLMDIAGATMLARTVERARLASLVDETIVATTTDLRDDAVVKECVRLGVPIFRGPEEDVLDRYYHAAKERSADAVVRVTSDCPLIDADVMDEVIAEFLEKRPDYAANTLERTYPRGLDTEVISLDALGRAWREAKKSSEREHVTAYMYQNPDVFRLISVRSRADNSRHRWTVDTPEDLSFVREVYGHLGPEGNFSWRDVLVLVESEPELSTINAGVRQKGVEER